MEEFVPLNVYLMKQEYMIDEKKKAVRPVKNIKAYFE